MIASATGLPAFMSPDTTADSGPSELIAVRDAVEGASALLGGMPVDPLAAFAPAPDMDLVSWKTTGRESLWPHSLTIWTSQCIKLPMVHFH